MANRFMNAISSWFIPRIEWVFGVKTSNVIISSNAEGFNVYENDAETKVLSVNPTTKVTSFGTYNVDLTLAQIPAVQASVTDGLATKLGYAEADAAADATTEGMFKYTLVEVGEAVTKSQLHMCMRIADVGEVATYAWILIKESV